MSGCVQRGGESFIVNSSSWLKSGLLVDAREAKTLTVPKLPSPEEQARRALTHLPYTAWCESCVTGRGQEEQHRKQHGLAKVTPVLAMDYCFLAVGEKDAETATTLVM